MPFCLLLNVVSSQENIKTLIEEDFVIRDFIVTKDSIFYLKKRNAYLFDKQTNSSHSYFIGGYGLKMTMSKRNNSIITVANELVDTISSVRFFSKKKEEFEFEFFYKEGKIIDFINIPEASLFVLSLTNKKIVFFDYKETPEFVKVIEIKLDSLSRKLIYKNNLLYFATDKGEVYEYDFYGYKKTLLYNANVAITDFFVNGNSIFYTSIDGGIFNINVDTKEVKKISLDNNFISTMEVSDNKLICGSWNGSVFIFDLASFTLLREAKIHNRAIINIKKGDNHIFYSSSLDKTLKSWTLK